jgi:hypothetical protein
MRACGDEQVIRDARLETRIRSHGHQKLVRLRDRLCPRGVARDGSGDVADVTALRSERKSGLPAARAVPHQG